MNPSTDNVRIEFNLAFLRGHILPPVLVFCALLIIWQGAVMIFGMRPYILPSPLEVGRTFADNFEQIAQAASVTAVSFLGGFLLALAVGLSLAVLIIVSPKLGRGIYPLLIASQTIPTIAIAPLLIIWLGFGLWVKVVISAVIAFFPIVVSAVLGFRSVSPTAVDLMRSFPASRTAIFRKLFIPSALPTIFAGMRTASVLSVIGAVVGEFVAGGDGLASHIIIARSQFETSRVMADLLGLAISGAIFYGVISALEFWALPWKRQSVRHGKRGPGRTNSAALGAARKPHVATP